MRQGVFEDPRDALGRMRRRQLEAVLRAEGFDYPQGIPATAARTMLRESGVDGRKYIDGQGRFTLPVRHRDRVKSEEGGQETPRSSARQSAGPVRRPDPVEQAVNVEQETESGPVGPIPTNYFRMKKYAKQLGLTTAPAIKKDDLLALIEQRLSEM